MSYPLQDSSLLVREMSSYMEMLNSTQFCWGVMMGGQQPGIDR